MPLADYKIYIGDVSDLEQQLNDLRDQFQAQQALRLNENPQPSITMNNSSNLTQN